MAKSFKEMTSSNESSLMIIDALNLAFRYKHSKKRNFAEDYIRTVQSLAHSYKAGEVIIAADGRGGSSYRKNLLPSYKGNRKEKYDKQTEAEAEDFKLFMQDYQNTLEQLKISYKVFQYDGVEADDIAAYITKVSDKNIWLISSDRDWSLLISKKVSQFSYVTRKEFTYENFEEHYNLPIEDYISFKCLVGDSGDNVPGVPGVGPKRAIGLIEQYGSVFDIIGNLPLDSKYKYIQSLNEFGEENLLLKFELMDLQEFSEEAIGKDNIKEIKEYVN